MYHSSCYKIRRNAPAGIIISMTMETFGLILYVYFSALKYELCQPGGTHCPVVRMLVYRSTDQDPLSRYNMMVCPLIETSCNYYSNIPIECSESGTCQSAIVINGKDYPL